MMQQSRATVLVVEDEPLIRYVASEMLTDGGCEALEAANADEALSILANHPDVHVLFTDINMPGIDGLELARRVHRSHPHIELVVTSGKRHLSDIQLPDDGTFLPKPYSSEQLLSVIESKLRN